MLNTRWTLTQRFEYQGQSIAFNVFGAGDPIVLVHGTPFSSFVWRKCAQELARSFTIYVYDLLGYGQSEKRPARTCPSACRTMCSPRF